MMSPFLSFRFLGGDTVYFPLLHLPVCELGPVVNIFQLSEPHFIINKIKTVTWQDQSINTKNEIYESAL